MNGVAELRNPVPPRPVPGGKGGNVPVSAAPVGAKPCPGVLTEVCPEFAFGPAGC